MEISMSQTTVTYLTILAPLLIQIVGLTAAVLVDSYISPKNRKILLINIALLITFIFQNITENMLRKGDLNINPEVIMLRTHMSVLGYCIRPIVIVMFCHIVCPDRRYRFAWALIGVNTAVHLTSYFSHVCFWIDPSNAYQGGPLSRFCLYVSASLFAYLFFITIHEFYNTGNRNFRIPILCLVFISIGVFLDFNVQLNEQIVTFLTISMIGSCLFYYLWLHLQFVKEHEHDLMMAQRLQIIMSQIKPHFLFNSLGAIEELCESNPKAAKEATVKFSLYLRGNMDSITTEKMISFEKELSHSKLYLELEQIRFEDALEVRYNISCDNFKIPALTVEPLAENAVLHGVRENDDGRGCVTISSREFHDRYEVSVADNGPGFDPDHIPDDGRDHIGIKNVRERLRKMCGGELLIESLPGHGTTSKIIIPKEGAS